MTRVVPMNDLYQAVLMDHYKRPRNASVLNKFSIQLSHFNPSCGDMVAIQALIEENIFVDVAIQAVGCVISVATASMLTEVIKGKSLDEIQLLDHSYIQKLLNMQLGPTRLKCALL